jgi:hypothetical protein
MILEMRLCQAAPSSSWMLPSTAATHLRIRPYALDLVWDRYPELSLTRITHPHDRASSWSPQVVPFSARLLSA